MTESGFPSMVVSPWFALYAPAGTPRRIVDTLYGALERSLNVASRLSSAVRARGSMSEAARLAGVDRTNLRRLMKRHDVQSDLYRRARRRTRR